MRIVIKTITIDINYEGTAKGSFGYTRACLKITNSIVIIAYYLIGY